MAPLPQIAPLTLGPVLSSQLGINITVLAPTSFTAITKSVPRTAIAAVGVLIFTELGLAPAMAPLT